MPITSYWSEWSRINQNEDFSVSTDKLKAFYGIGMNWSIQLNKLIKKINFIKDNKTVLIKKEKKWCLTISTCVPFRTALKSMSVSSWSFGQSTGFSTGWPGFTSRQNLLSEKWLSWGSYNTSSEMHHSFGSMHLHFFLVNKWGIHSI